MKKFVKIIYLAMFSILVVSLSSCKDKKDEITKLEIIANPTLDYKVGQNANSFKAKGGKIKVSYKYKTSEEIDVSDAMLTGFSYETGKVMINYQNKSITVNVLGLNYVDSNETLIATQNSYQDVFFIKAGDYNLETLRYTKDIALVGIGKVTINLSLQESGQTAALFSGDTTLANIEFNSTYDPLLISCVKVGKIESNGDVAYINSAYLSDLIIKGGKGLVVTAVKKIVLDNIDVKVVSEVKNVAMSLSGGTNAELLNSNISSGTWGSIAIFGVNSDSDKQWYKRKSTLDIKDTEISGAVYIEFYSVSSSVVTGLSDWNMVEQNDYRVYTKIQQQAG